MKAALREHGGKHSLFYAGEKGMPELVAEFLKEGADASLTDGVRACAYVTMHVYIKSETQDARVLLQASRPFPLLPSSCPMHTCMHHVTHSHTRTEIDIDLYRHWRN